MKTILLLEDEPSVMKLVRHMLKQYDVIEATTVEEALLLFNDRNHRVDLLVADLTVPKLSGIQVALLVRAEFPGMPVILTSGYPVSGWSSRDSADLLRLGSNSVVTLQKPFQAHLFLNTVCELIGIANPDRTIAA